MGASSTEVSPRRRSGLFLSTFTPMTLRLPLRLDPGMRRNDGRCGTDAGGVSDPVLRVGCGQKDAGREGAPGPLRLCLPASAVGDGDQRGDALDRDAAVERLGLFRLHLQE